MPLKHNVETIMVVVLGLMIALAGAATAFLPPVSVSIIPWIVAFALSLLYPLALYPMMKERRADYEFRALHFAPALILLVWLAIDLIASFKPGWEALQSAYTWGWAAAIVLAAFVLLGIFCVRVLRQSMLRIGLLLAVLLPFIILSQFSQNQGWDRQLAAFLWNEDTNTGTGIIASNGSSSNLSPSSDEAEEQWRAQLRRMERRRQRLENGDESSSAVSSLSVSGAKTGTVIAAGGLPQPTDEPKDPPRLPSSGFGSESIAFMALAGYCAALHRKTILRKRA